MGTATVAIALAVAVGGLVIGLLVLTTKGADQARLTVDGPRLRVEPLGMMSVWSLSSGVEVPLSSVVSVAAVDRSTVPLGLRAPGAYLPGVVCAGTYRRRGSKGLWMVGGAPQVVDIELHGERYDRLVVQVADPVAAVTTLRAALHP